MLFTHDTELTLRAACGLINTDRMDVEQLGDAAALEAFLDGWGYTGRRDHDTAELASIPVVIFFQGEASSSRA